MITSLLRCHDYIWAFLHSVILNIPPGRLALFPSLAGSVWFLTLASLLLTWIGRGMRPYPGQSNPHVPFVSDIASFELKPLFLVGASITAMGFLFTVAAVHVMRYEPGFALIRCPEYASIHHQNQTQNQTQTQTPDITDEEDEHSSPRTPDHGHLTSQNQEVQDDDDEEEEEEEDHDTTKTLKIISLCSIFAAGVASTSLTLLSVMDTFRYKFAHHIFLRLCFAGLAVQSAGTAIVYADEVLGVISYVSHLGKAHHNWGRRSFRVRVFATLSTSLILIEVFLGVAFLSLTVDEETSNYCAAGILEWIIVFLGTIYLWLFCGFFDRTDFNGYVPSFLYRSPSRDTLIPVPVPVPVPWTGPSSWDERRGARVDLERTPLLGHVVDGKYT